MSNLQETGEGEEKEEEEEKEVDRSQYTRNYHSEVIDLKRVINSNCCLFYFTKILQAFGRVPSIIYS